MTTKADLGKLKWSNPTTLHGHIVEWRSGPWKLAYDYGDGKWNVWFHQSVMTRCEGSAKAMAFANNVQMFIDRAHEINLTDPAGVLFVIHLPDNGEIHVPLTSNWTEGDVQSFLDLAVPALYPNTWTEISRPSARVFKVAYGDHAERN